ncbi:hypothetical protein PM082_000117 [Marasmius tenuissimus]|nr:hypothetical protein PM082_000117 [Marasmius tenuissimus]
MSLTYCALKFPDNDSDGNHPGESNKYRETYLNEGAFVLSRKCTVNKPIAFGDTPMPEFKGLSELPSKYLRNVSSRLPEACVKDQSIGWPSEALRHGGIALLEDERNEAGLGSAFPTD